MMVPKICLRTLSLFLFCIAAGQRGTDALQWSNSTDVPVIYICSGKALYFPWVFSLEPGEQLEDVKWLFSPGTPPGSTPDLMANYIYGHFIAMPPFSHRLVYLGSGNLELSQVRSSDGGTYSVEVVTVRQGRSNGFVSARRQVDVKIVEPPSGIATNLTIEMTKQAVHDDVTREWHVVMTCKPLLADGHSGPDVTWTTPYGSGLQSSYSANGTFFLVVPNPVRGGDYNCHLPYDPKATLCLPGNVTLVTDASLHLGDFGAAHLLLQAKQEVLLEQNRQLSHQLKLTANKLSQTDAVLNSIQQELKGLRHCCGTKSTFAANDGFTHRPGTTYSPPIKAGDASTQRFWWNVVSTPDENSEKTSSSSPFGRVSTQPEANGPQGMTVMSYETTEAEPHSRVTRNSFVRRNRQSTSTVKDDLNLVCQNLTEHINEVESKLQQYQASFCRKIAFHAQASHKDYRDNEHILFNKEVFLNEGNAFHQSSGEFVVPVSGVYVFLASTSAYGVYGSSCNADLMVDSRPVARMLGKYAGNYQQETGHAIMHLHRGQRVWVKSIGVTSIDIRSMFSGFLLKADC